MSDSRCARSANSRSRITTTPTRMPRRVDHVRIGDERALDQLAQLLDRLPDGHLRREDADRRVHEAADAAFGEGLVERPLAAALGRGGEDVLLPLLGQAGQQVLGGGRVHLLQDLDDGLRRLRGQPLRPVVGRLLRDLRRTARPPRLRPRPGARVARLRPSPLLDGGLSHRAASVDPARDEQVRLPAPSGWPGWRTTRGSVRRG